MTRPQGRLLSGKGTLPSAAALLAALALQACGAFPGPGDSQGGPANTPQAVDSAFEPPGKSYPAPAHLAGLDGSQVKGLLGPPPFMRRDNPAQIWQYRTAYCLLDVFLYRDGKGEVYKVRHFEARASGEKTVSDKDCFESLLKAHEKRQSG